MSYLELEAFRDTPLRRPERIRRGYGDTANEEDKDRW
jgi:hypothetical protein